jgi:hypothetical protein
MPSRLRPLPAGFIAPCLPTSAPRPPCGALWLHEIKHDGFWVIARKNGQRVKLYSRPGNDLTYRFLLIVEGMARLRLRSWRYPEATNRPSLAKPQICDGRHSGTGRSMSYWPRLADTEKKLMSKHQSNAINTSRTSKQLRKSTDRELTKEELDQVVGGSLTLNFTKAELKNSQFKA